MIARLSSIRVTLIIVIAFSLLLVMAAGCGGGDGGATDAGEMSIEELWQAAEEADMNMVSWHMEIASYYENTQYDSGQIQSIIIDVNGDDIHEQDLLLGQIYFEYKLVGGKQYIKNMENGVWEEVQEESPSDNVSEYTNQFLELPSLASSEEHLGTELIDGNDTEHYRFILSSESASQMFSSQPSFDFSQNSGGEVEVWIDSDEYYLVRYDIIIRNVDIPEKIGQGDIRFVVNISDINEPIEITPPA